MKSLTKNQLAVIEGGIPYCPSICSQAQFNVWYSNNPLLVMLSFKILRSKQCQNCEM